MENAAVAKRMKTIQGHVNGITRMVDEGQYCIDVIRQIKAVQSAMNKVSQMILEEHMNSCMITAIQGDDASERERVLAEVAEVFEMANKI